MTSRYNVIGNLAAVGRRFEIGRAIEQPKIWLVDELSKFRRCD
jgi:hypothetical protein